MSNGKTSVSWADRFEGVRASFDPVHGIASTGEEDLRKAFALLEGLKEIPPEMAQALETVGASLLHIKEALGDELSLGGMYPRLARAMVNPNDRRSWAQVWEQIEEVITVAAAGRDALVSLDGTLQAVAEANPEAGEALKGKIKALQGIYSLLGAKVNLATRCFAGQWTAVRDATNPPRAQRNNQERS